ncbi:MAG: FAD:protein FMN transferase [Fuerstiella sp.]|jgi:thiamine biosynthesis lipoprotein|nr:FAD:protein FMN transferase [Fuerstiella sp.]
MFTLRLFTVCLTATLIFAASAIRADEPLRLFGRTMGTHYVVTVDSPAVAGDGAALHRRIEFRLAEINAQMSTWDRSSEITRFNDSQSTDWFDVSAEFVLVVAEAKRIFECTEGAFDPTLSPLIDLWGFGDDRIKAVPEASAIRAASKSVGMQHVELRSKPPALKKSLPGIQLNLSAIAKGYAVDAVAALLADQNITSFMVDIGGENRGGQPKANGNAWRAGIESPLNAPLPGQELPFSRIVELNEASVATSGDYRNFFEIDGSRYSHAIDPATGWPVKEPPAAVSVVHQSCMSADAWATAMMVLGSKQGLLLAREQNLSVLFQYVTDNGQIQEFATGLLAEPSAEPQAAPAKNAEEPTGSNTSSSSTSAPWFPFVAAAAVFIIAIAGMAIGTIIQNKHLKGSCGGLAAMPGSDGKSACELCTLPKDQCTNAEIREKMQSASENADSA